MPRWRDRDTSSISCWSAIFDHVSGMQCGNRSNQTTMRYQTPDSVDGQAAKVVINIKPVPEVIQPFFPRGGGNGGIIGGIRKHFCQLVASGGP